MRRVVVLGVLLVGIAGSARAASASDPKAYVLQSADLPGWVVKKTETITASPGLILGGYGVLYQNPGVLRGLIQVDSKSAICASAAVAHRAMSLVFVRPHGYHRMAARPGIGDESALFEQSKTGSTGYRLVVYLVIWRSGGVVGAVFGGGIAGTFHVADVVALARRQQARIAQQAH